MSWRKLIGRSEPAPSTHLREAAAAVQRAQADIRAVEERRPEVQSRYNGLVERRLKNNFGPSLEIAMQRKNLAVDH